TGAASNGPTAILKSCAKLPHRRLANGTSLLLDFQPFLLRKTETLATFTSLVKSAMSLSLMQLHCNIINTAKLEEAKLHPELYGDLIVRVAGYSDYFVRFLTRHLLWKIELPNYGRPRSKRDIFQLESPDNIGAFLLFQQAVKKEMIKKRLKRFR
ncbi:MAG: glycine radical domain-containing protein, partial [Planctomycetota bacterium]